MQFVITNVKIISQEKGNKKEFYFMEKNFLEEKNLSCSSETIRIIFILASLIINVRAPRQFT